MSSKSLPEPEAPLAGAEGGGVEEGVLGDTVVLRRAGATIRVFPFFFLFV
jgi:hypothetical protein